MNRNEATLVDQLENTSPQDVGRDFRPSSTASRVEESEQTTLNRKLFFIASLAALASFLVYLKTLAPTITGGDAGELITAAYSLGIPHPPGYPIWCLFGKLFTYLPFGEVAYGVNLMSAFWSALATGMFCLLMFKLTGRVTVVVSTGSNLYS